MRGITVAALVVLTGVACQDTPVQPTTEEAGNAASASLVGTPGFQLLFTFPVSFVDYYACLNGGQGGLATFYGTYSAWEKLVANPAGGANRTQEIIYTSHPSRPNDPPYLETASGEIWWLTSDKQVGHIITNPHTGVSTGKWAEPGTFRNDAGDVLVFRGLYRFVWYNFTPADYFTPDEAEYLTTCHGSVAN